METVLRNYERRLDTIHLRYGSFVLTVIITTYFYLGTLF